MKTVLNLKNIDTTKQPLFLGEDLNLQRYDRFKYPIFFELFKKQNENFWWPHEITLSKDRSDYNDLTDTERFVFDSNLRFQTLGDSMLSRSIHSLKEYVTNPELEICMNTWAQFEGIHSYSYSYLLNNVYPDATKFFDSIMEDKEILNRAELIRNSYDKILGDEYLKGLNKYDIVFRSPGIYFDLPELLDARNHGVEISSQMKLFFELCPCPIIGVTGTKGKGTTSSLIY